MLLGNGRTSLNLKVDTKQVWADEQGFEVSTSDVDCLMLKLVP